MAHTLTNAIKSYHCDMEDIIEDFKFDGDSLQQMKIQTNARYFEAFIFIVILLTN